MHDASLPHGLRLEDLRWLRQLAGRLVRDANLADDAVQETMVAAMERGPEIPRNPRAWLAAVLRNVVRQEWRGRARRAARESAAEPPRALPSTFEVIEELALHRRLVEEVHALEEPSRSAILLHYLRGLSAAEIARDLGVPVKTVRTRLDRGIAKLRERLGRDRSAWRALLAGAAPRGSSLAPPLIPWLLPMNVKAISALVCLTLLGTFLALRGSAPEPEPALEALASAPEEVAAPVGAPSMPAASREAVEVEPAAGEQRPPPPALALAGGSVHGFVRTLDGRGVAGIEVVFERRVDGGFERAPGVPRALSAQDGAFELALSELQGRLNVADDRYVGVAMPHLDRALLPAELIVVVAPSCEYSGRVVDGAGAPIPRAKVEITLDGPIVHSRSVGGAAVHLLLPFAEALCDEFGRFRFTHVGFVEGAHLSAQADGFEPGRLELPSSSREHLELVLSPAAKSRTIFGLVIEASGAPAAEARVSVGGASVPCGPDGSFQLDCESWREDGWLCAIRPGALPAEMPLDETLQPSSREKPLVLRLGGSPLAIRGRVIDELGEPVGGAVVFTPDTTPFGLVDYAESGRSIQGNTTMEAFVTGRMDPWVSAVHCVTESDGSFALEGLIGRVYAVFVLDSRGLDGIGPIELRAGVEGAEVRLPQAPRNRVAGRVVSRSGVPLAGVRLTLGRHFPWRTDGRASVARWSGIPMGAPRASWSLQAPAATTDGEGRFELPELVTSGSYLTLRGQSLVLGAHFELDESSDPGAVVIAVDAACRFQLELRSPAEADAISLENPAGGRIVLLLEVEGLTISADRMAVDGGRTGVGLVEEGDYVVVLYAGEKELRRQRLSFPAGGLHRLEP